MNKYINNRRSEETLVYLEKARSSRAAGDANGYLIKSDLFPIAELVLNDLQHEGCAGVQAGYDSEFYRFLLIKRTNIGCRPELFPRGYDFFLFNVETRGLLEDLLVYLLNYHKILGCR